MKLGRRWSSLAVQLGLVAAHVAGCGSGPPPPLDYSATLEQGVVASVAGESIAATTVGRIAKAQGLDARAACDRAISDALFAAEARHNSKSSAEVRSIEQLTLARAVLEQILREARAQGPPTDDEIAALTRERWVELDRPTSARTAHALVMVKDPKEKARARALANRIAEATKGATNGTDFRKLADAVPRDGLEVRVEPLPPTTADGRVFEPNDPSLRQQFEEDFARAANAIPEVGTNSPVVETKYGFHVIHLIERLPERRIPIEQRRSLLADEIVAKRAALLEQRVLDQLRRTTKISVDRSAVDLLSKLRVAE